MADIFNLSDLYFSPDKFARLEPKIHRRVEERTIEGFGLAAPTLMKKFSDLRIRFHNLQRRTNKHKSQLDAELLKVSALLQDLNLWKILNVDQLKQGMIDLESYKPNTEDEQKDYVEYYHDIEKEILALKIMMTALATKNITTSIMVNKSNKITVEHKSLETRLHDLESELSSHSALFGPSKVLTDFNKEIKLHKDNDLAAIESNTLRLFKKDTKQSSVVTDIEKILPSVTLDTFTQRITDTMKNWDDALKASNRRKDEETKKIFDVSLAQKKLQENLQEEIKQLRRKTKGPTGSIVKREIPTETVVMEKHDIVDGGVVVNTKKEPEATEIIKEFNVALAAATLAKKEEELLKSQQIQKKLEEKQKQENAERLQKENEEVTKKIEKEKKMEEVREKLAQAQRALEAEKTRKQEEEEKNNEILFLIEALELDNAVLIENGTSAEVVRGKLKSLGVTIDDVKTYIKKVEGRKEEIEKKNSEEAEHNIDAVTEKLSEEELTFRVDTKLENVEVKQRYSTCGVNALVNSYVQLDAAASGSNRLPLTEDMAKDMGLTYPFGQEYEWLYADDLWGLMKNTKYASQVFVVEAVGIFNNNYTFNMFLDWERCMTTLADQPVCLIINSGNTATYKSMEKKTKYKEMLALHWIAVYVPAYKDVAVNNNVVEPIFMDSLGSAVYFQSMKATIDIGVKTLYRGAKKIYDEQKKQKDVQEKNGEIEQVQNTKEPELLKIQKEAVTDKEEEEEKDSWSTDKYNTLVYNLNNYANSCKAFYTSVITVMERVDHLKYLVARFQKDRLDGFPMSELTSRIVAYHENYPEDFSLGELDSGNPGAISKKVNDLLWEYYGDTPVNEETMQKLKLLRQRWFETIEDNVSANLTKMVDAIRPEKVKKESDARAYVSKTLRVFLRIWTDPKVDFVGHSWISLRLLFSSLLNCNQWFTKYNVRLGADGKKTFTLSPAEGIYAENGWVFLGSFTALKTMQENQEKVMIQIQMEDTKGKNIFFPFSKVGGLLDSLDSVEKGMMLKQTKMGQSDLPKDALETTSNKVVLLSKTLNAVSRYFRKWLPAEIEKSASIGKYGKNFMEEVTTIDLPNPTFGFYFLPKDANDLSICGLLNTYVHTSCQLSYYYDTFGYVLGYYARYLDDVQSHMLDEEDLSRRLSALLLTYKNLDQDTKEMTPCIGYYTLERLITLVSNDLQDIEKYKNSNLYELIKDS